MEDTSTKQKKTRKRKALTRPTLVQFEDKRVKVPEALPTGSPLSEVVHHVQQQDKVILLLHTALAHYRTMFQSIKAKSEIDLDCVFALATKGSTKREISILLNINYKMWMQREDLARAYDEGLTLMKQGLRDKQLDAALGGSERLMIWLGKQYLDQQDTPPVSIEINNGSADISELRKKVLERRAQAKQVFVDIVDGVVTESDDR